MHYITRIEQISPRGSDRNSFDHTHVVHPFGTFWSEMRLSVTTCCSRQLLESAAEPQECLSVEVGLASPFHCNDERARSSFQENYLREINVDKFKHLRFTIAMFASLRPRTGHKRVEEEGGTRGWREQGNKEGERGSAVASSLYSNTSTRLLWDFTPLLT